MAIKKIKKPNGETIRFIKKKVVRMMVTLCISYIFLCSILFIFQRKLQYLPSGTLYNISDYGIEGATQENLITKDNIEIATWFKEPRNNEKIIIYFHGNAGNLGNRSRKLRAFLENSDYGLLAVSYRGYPGSKGKPNEKGLLLDAEAATDFLISKGYNNKDFILYGESLGSGVAVQHAFKINPAGLILESPFYSIARIARKLYWYIPTDLLLKDRFDSYKYARELSAPVIIFHGNKDNVVPYEEGKRLFYEFGGRKTFVTMSQGGHLNFDEMTLINGIKDFFNH